MYYFVISQITGAPKQLLLLTCGAVANTCIVFKDLQRTTLKETSELRMAEIC